MNHKEEMQYLKENDPIISCYRSGLRCPKLKLKIYYNEYES